MSPININDSDVKIINFHEINGIHETRWFEEIVIYLKENKKIISVDELHKNLRNQELQKELFLLTVDDGHKSFYKNIFPIIKKYKIPIALFVSPKICKNKENFWWQEIVGYDNILLKEIISDIYKIPVLLLNNISLNSIIKSLKINEVYEVISKYQKASKTNKKSFKNMTVSDLIEVENSGLVSIGAHAMNHPVLFNEDDDVSKYEIMESIDGLGNILGHEIKYFAYPNGIPKIDYSDREVNYVKSKGINLSFSTEFKKVSKNSNLMEIPRGEVSSGRFSVQTKLCLWEHWRFLTNIKNKNKERNDRKIITSLLRG